MSTTISSLPLPRVSIIADKSKYSDKKLLPQMTSPASFKKSRKSTMASAKTTVTFNTPTPTTSVGTKRSASPRKSATTTVKTSSSGKSSRKSASERSDYRTLSFETIASINWVKHCYIRREQMPLKLRSCFVISKLPLIKST